MCGIAGFVGWQGSPEEAASLVRSMCDALHHRGPDDEGIYVAPKVALGMRRLSIIDLEGGAQPIGNEDRSVQVVFNGEIYNYREIRQRLAKGAHAFATSGDTEVLVHLYEDLGDALVHELRGMFAFALWDARRQRLLLGRDRLGIKPLYYWEVDEGLVFGSELKALRRFPGFPDALDSSSVADYLALGYVPDPSSIFAGVRKLEPGHLLTWSPADGSATLPYWTPFGEEDTSLDEREAVEELQRLLADSVRCRMIADVPLGAFLSGGTDSAAVVAEMVRQSSSKVRTFSIGFEEEGYNEAPAAAATARALGTDHEELIVRPDEELFDDVALAFDEPFADSSAVPTLLVSRLARRHVTVALSGDGGDELFGGYTRYLDLARRGGPVPAPFRRAIAAFAVWLPYGFWGRNRLLELSRTPEGRYAGMVAHALSEVEGGVGRPALASRGRDLESLLQRWYARVPDRDPLTRATFVDLLSYLPGDILTKVDRMTMAVSLEARVPLLDHHLVEFACRIPARLKFRNGTGKWILRRAIEEFVPAEVLTRPKSGFGVPLGPWFRAELENRASRLPESKSDLFHFVEPRAVRRVLKEHATGRRDHSGLIWRLLVLATWLEHHSTASRQPATASEPRGCEADNPAGSGHVAP